MKVINLYAGPGVGKSTIAAGLFHEMKKKGQSVELVTEYAKDMTWEQRFNVLNDQIYVFAKQQRRVDRLKDHAVDFVISDGPALLSLVYFSGPHLSEFSKLALSVYNANDNLNVLLTRSFDYDPVGRNQTYEQALEVDEKVKLMLDFYEVPHVEVSAGNAIEDIMNML